MNVLLTGEEFTFKDPLNVVEASKVLKSFWMFHYIVNVCLNFQKDESIQIKNHEEAMQKLIKFSRYAYLAYITRNFDMLKKDLNSDSSSSGN